MTEESRPASLTLQDGPLTSFSLTARRNIFRDATWLFEGIAFRPSAVLTRSSESPAMMWISVGESSSLGESWVSVPQPSCGITAEHTLRVLEAAGRLRQ